MCQDYENNREGDAQNRGRNRDDNSSSRPLLPGDSCFFCGALDHWARDYPYNHAKHANPGEEGDALTDA